ncbi:MAG: type III-B CRISPR module RAMP protein Cmr1 [Methylococcales bacterium]|nr:type III-B CRISPR module RAMP protein Cmr1 [Methylococcales bacterium]
MPSKITASYRIVTPMFIGDANQQASDISPTSVKGALRFWWRALNWGKALKEANNNEAAALRELHAQEAKLFGGLAETVNDEQTGGQGAFLLRVTDNTQSLSASKLDNDYSLNGAWQSYLLGLGLIKYENHANHYLRSAIVSGSFSVQLYCKNSHYQQELENLLLLWGLLGGLGSRQRKGLGSISITELKVNNEIIALPQNRQAVLEKLGRLIDKSAVNEPPYTAFSQSSRILCSPTKRQKPWEILGDIAKDIQLFRGWGFDAGGGHRINRIPANHNAYSHKQTDHDIVYDYTERAVLTKQLPESITFGLPRSYNLSTRPRSEFRLDVQATNQNDEAKRSRRASPVFIHIHQFPNEETMIIQSFLPATFLAVNDQVQIQQKIGNRWDNVDSVNPATSWQVITDYLNTFSTWQAV